MSARRHGSGGCPPFLRKVLAWTLAACAGLLLLGFIGYAQLLSYLQGDAFRARLQQSLVNKAQAEGAAMQDRLEIDANRVSLKALSLWWNAGMLQEVGGKSIHAELRRSALLDRKLHLTRLMVEEGTLALNLDRKGDKRPKVKTSGGTLLSRLAPTSAELERFDCKDFNATLRFSGQEYRLSDSSLSANPLAPQGGMGEKGGIGEKGGKGSKGGKATWEFRFNNGRVHTPLPLIAESNLKNATLTLGGTHATLSDARLMLSPGELILNAVAETATGNWSADIRANSVDVSRLIGEDWKKRLTGMLYGRMRMDGQADGLQVAEGKLSLQQGVLEALPFLENLPVGNSYPYRSLRLEKATARLSFPHADAARNIRRAWLLDGIDLRAEGGWLRMKGHALVDADGSLGGTLLIGIPEAIATRLAPVASPLYSSLFNAEGDAGYVWLRLNLSGSFREPQEDLSVRLMTLIGSAVPETAAMLRNMLLPAGEPSPAEQPAPADAASSDAPAPAAPAPAKLMQKAGEAAGDLIHSGLRGLF